MSIEINKKKSSLLVSIQTFLVRNELVVDGVSMPLTPTTLARHTDLGYSAAMLCYCFTGQKPFSRNVSKKLLKMGFPAYIPRLYAEKRKEKP